MFRTWWRKWTPWIFGRALEWWILVKTSKGVPRIISFTALCVMAADNTNLMVAPSKINLRCAAFSRFCWELLFSLLKLWSVTSLLTSFLAFSTQTRPTFTPVQSCLACKQIVDQKWLRGLIYHKWFVQWLWLVSRCVTWERRKQNGMCMAWFFCFVKPSNCGEGVEVLSR